MKKLIPIILVVLLFSGCTLSGAETSLPKPTDSDSALLSESDSIPTPEPTPLTAEKSVALSTIVSENERFLKPLNRDTDFDFQTEMETPIGELIASGDSAYYVEFNQDRMNGLQLDRPDMPTYIWHINGSHADMIKEVVVEFDLLETIHPLHPGFFSYDIGYFITLHYDQSIRADPIEQEIQLHGNIEVIEIPELGEDLRKYAKQEDTHVTITIPYSEFQAAAKDLTLQFLPGTTFANLSVSLWGANALNETIVGEIAQKADRPNHDLLNELLTLLDEPKEAWHVPSQKGAVLGEVGNKIWQYDGLGIVAASDGSINMPVAFYDLGEYADEVTGKYAVIPEGLVPAFAILSSCAYLGDIQEHLDLQVQYKRKLVDFAFKNLMDETGQFYGVYDIAQGKTVATGRKSPALPILTNMCRSICGLPDTAVLSDKEMRFILNSIITNDIIRVADKLYYAPRGISENGVMALRLSDFAISDLLFSELIDYSVDENSLDEKYGVAMLLEGYINSLKLVVESQEQNETRLPSSQLNVVFKDEGNSYELQPSDIFDINDSFFFNLGIIGTLSDNFPGEGAALSKLTFEKTKQSITKRLRGGENGVYNESQKRYIRECERQYAEYYNIYEIQTTLYECFLHIYNFLQMQPIETAYAAKYNVHTGEMIEAETDNLYPVFHDVMAPMLSRIGTPATLMNYNLLVGVFNDETELIETAKVIPFMYERWMGDKAFSSPSAERSDPDLYADNGFDIWGYDSLYPMGECHTAYSSTKPFYNGLGFSFNRENWLEYTMRKLNENIRDDEEHVSPDDAFPLFYDHIPKAQIAN